MPMRPMNSCRFSLRIMVHCVAAVYMGALASIASAAEFRADMAVRSGSTTSVQRYYQKGDMSRREIPASRPKQVQIRRPDKDRRCVLLRIVNLRNKTYVEGTIKAGASMESQIAKACRRVGDERVNGYDCIKYVSPDSKSTVWFSRKLNLQMKSVDETPHGTITTEYRNIIERPLPDSLFEVPRGYKKEIIRG